jgi:hypothetical protein
VALAVTNLTQNLYAAAVCTRYWNKLWKKTLPHAHLPAQLQEEHVSGLLQLCMNCSSGETAMTAAQMLEPLGLLTEAASTTNAGLLHWLLVTAAARQHQLAFLHMAGQAAILQHVDAATLQSVLELLITWGDTTCIDVLLRKLQPAAVQQLSPEAVAHLLQAAVGTDSFAAAEHLCGLPAASQLSASSVPQLLEAAWKQDSHVCAALLFDLPAVQQLSASMVARLAEVTLQQGNGPYASRLFALPAAQQLTADMAARLLEIAIQQSDEMYVWRLHCVPAAMQLGSSMVVKLLLAALSRGPAGIEHVSNLSQLPAAAHVSSEEAEQLLHAAEGHMTTRGRLALCQVPAVAAMMKVRLNAMRSRRKLWGLQPEIVMEVPSVFDVHDSSCDALAVAVKVAAAERLLES